MPSLPALLRPAGHPIQVGCLQLARRLWFGRVVVPSRHSRDGWVDGVWRVGLGDLSEPEGGLRNVRGRPDMIGLGERELWRVCAGFG
jgi:hypothetical protein